MFKAAHLWAAFLFFHYPYIPFCLTKVEEASFEDSFSISPNPCSDIVNFRYSISDVGYVVLDLFSISVVKIKSLLNQEQIPGTYEIQIDLRNIPAGVYFCVLKTNDPNFSEQTKKIIKL